jgi:hypothetical protein
MVIEPASSLTNFLKMYSTTGIATATLQSLIGVYNSPQMTHLSLLNPVLSDHDRWQYEPQIPNLMEGKLFHVHLFKKIGPTVPAGLTSQTLVDFFVSQFTFKGEKEAEDDFQEATKSLVNCPNYSIIAITALTFDTLEKKLEHQIVGVVSYMHDKNGSFIFTLCVLDKGLNDGLSLSPQYFSKSPRKVGLKIRPFSRKLLPFAIRVWLRSCSPLFRLLRSPATPSLMWIIRRTLIRSFATKQQSHRYIIYICKAVLNQGLDILFI